MCGRCLRLVLLPIAALLLGKAPLTFSGCMWQGVGPPGPSRPLQHLSDSVCWGGSCREPVQQGRSPNVQVHISTSCLLDSSDTESTRQDIVRQLRALGYDGYEILAVARVNEQVDSLDPLMLHGFVLLALEDPEGKQQFGRLDFGEDGYALQLGADLQEFKKYVELPNMLVNQAIHFWGIPTAGLFLAELLAVPAAGVDAAIVAFVTVAAPSWLAQNTQFLSAPKGALKRLVALFDDLENDSYDLCEFNCNHFAEFAVQEITTPSSSST